MASFLYNSFKRDAMAGTIQLDGSDVIYIMLLQDTYTTQTASTITGVSDFRDHVHAYECTAGGTTGYTTGGTGIYTTTTQMVVSADMTTNHLGYWDCTYDVNWTSAYITARYAVVYKSVGTSATDPLVCCFDFGTNQTATNGTFTIQWSSAGFIRLS